MNLNNQPTIEELAQLFASRKDTLDNHILWVCESGEVHIDGMARHAGEAEFEQSKPTMRARLRTYRRGQGYIGRKAAADREFIGRVLHTLEDQWPEARQAQQVKVIDQYC
ncbi:MULTISPECIES: hypothetical protein [Pseudomonas]|uniref:Uncharacterized protein n=1 Tax=Pseudomonas eucalypticola TaxID=2599595 RepID=A0A7D5HGM9_9PSED|nr:MULTISPECIES: hypothetical protein [Pseudomonas]QKZ04766.1 hypothetical protein HWQ56_13610 [Pseudomonas eucalypticola]